MSQLVVVASQAFQTLMAAANLTDKACSEILELREGVKWARSTVHSKRSGSTPLSLDDIEVLAKFFAVPVSFFVMDRHERLKWLGETKWCAPWEIDPSGQDIPVFKSEHYRESSGLHADQLELALAS
jgi:hypothetical protein